MGAARALGVARDGDAGPGRGRDAIPFAEDYEHAPTTLKPNTLVASAAASRPGAEGIPQPFPGQGEPGSILLGQFRPGIDALLRTACAASSRRSAELPGLRHGRGLLARVQQLRILARQRRIPWSPRSIRTLIPSLPATRNTRSNRRGRVTTSTCTSSSCRTRSSAPLRDPTKHFSRFLQSTYDAAAALADWDRAALERPARSTAWRARLTTANRGFPLTG